MLPQEVFNTVVEALRKQNSHSVAYNEDGSVRMRPSGLPVCRYLSKDGKKCAAGDLLLNEEYSTGIEGLNIAIVMGCIPSLKERLFEHLPLISALQNVHDQYYVREWESQFEQVASKFHLIYTPPNQ